MTIWTEQAPKFPAAGNFDAWLGYSSDEHNSAATWRVACLSYDAEIYEDGARSEGKSTDQRAALAALCGILEALPSGSSVQVHTRSQYLRTVIVNISKWKECDWELSKRRAANTDLLQRIFAVMTARHLAVVVEWEPNGSHEGIERMMRKAASLRRGTS